MLPAGVQTVTVNFGPYRDFAGVALRGETVFTPSVQVRVVASGEPLIPRPLTVVWDDQGSGSIVLPAVDSAGLDRSDWTYTVTHRAYTNGTPAPRGKVIKPLAAAPVIDLEQLAETATSTGIVVAQPAVVSVAGLSGAPTAQELTDALGEPLRAAFVPFWKAAETVTTGTVRVDSTGHLITANSNRTTRGSYDATEQAAWTVVSGGGGGVADGSVTPAKLSFDPATQTELNAYLVTLAANPDSIITGTITRDANGAATSAAVTWPDGSPGTYTADTVSTAFPGGVDAYHVTYGSPVTKTYTQPAVTRDATGAVTARPALVVS